MDGNWLPVSAGNTDKGPNSTHMGFVTASERGNDGDVLTLRVHLQADPWAGGEGEAAYRVRLAMNGVQCTGSWTGAGRRGS